MTTSRNTWKQFERRIAEKFNTKRTPLSGINSSITASDTQHSKLFIEAKLRAKSAIHNLFEKTERLAYIEKKIPILALQKKNEKDFLIVCRFSDIKNIVKEIKLEKQNGN